MHIVTGSAQVAAATLVDDERLVAPAEQMAEEFMPTIEATSISPEEPFHARDEIGLRRLSDEMEMIFHETKGVELPAGFFAGFAQCVEEGAAILVVLEDGFAPVTAIHEVIHGTRKLNTQRAGHGARSPKPTTIVNC